MRRGRKGKAWGMKLGGVGDGDEGLQEGGGVEGRGSQCGCLRGTSVKYKIWIDVTVCLDLLLAARMSCTQHQVC